MKKLSLITGTLLPMALSQCVMYTEYVVKPVTVDPKASVAEREKLYADSTVAVDKKPPSPHTPYKVGDKYYSRNGIEPIFSMPYTSEKTKSFRGKASTWQTLGDITGVIGGGALGWNVGVLFGTGSKSAFYYPWLWGVAGGGIVMAFVFGSFASDNFEKAIASYNEDVKKLVLPEKVTSDLWYYYDRPQVFALSYSHSF
jgi:hypothetical protein